jgi:hypothetical protein
MRTARYAAVALAVLAVSLPAGAAAPQQVFVLDGRGHGHGVGMAQDSANAMAAAGASHTQILDLFYPGTSRARRSSSIRVAVWEAGAPNGSVTVRAPGGARVSSGGAAKDAPPGSVLQVSADAAGFHVRTAAPTRGSAVRAGLLAEPSPSPEGPLPAARRREPSRASGLLRAVAEAAAPPRRPAPPAAPEPRRGEPGARRRLLLRQRVAR